MADNNFIEIDIVMSDGSIQKGKIALTKAIEQAAKDGTSGMEKSFDNATGAIVNKFSSKFKEFFGFGLSKELVVASVAVGALGYAIEKAFDFTLAGERLALVGNQFDILTQKAGISGAALKDALMQASGGFLSDDEILASANKALVELGSNAARIPEVMEIARKATLIFGGDIATNFELINRAIASGQTRSLKQIGITVDANRALQEFSRTNGIAASTISETGKQQALLEAVLRRSKEQYRGVSEAVTPVTNEYKKLSVAIHDLGDKTEIAAAKIFGSAFGKLTSGLGDVATSFGSFISRLSGTETAQDKISRLSKEVEQLNFQINSPVTEKALLPTLKAQLEAAQTQLSKASKSVQDFNSRVKGDVEGSGASSGLGKDAQDPALVAKQKAAFENQMSQAKQQTIAIEEARAQLFLDYSDKQAEIKRITAEKLQLIDDEFAAKRKAIDSSDEFSAIQKSEYKVELARQEKEKIAQIQQEATEQVPVDSIGEGFGAMLAGADSAISEFAANSQKNFREVGKAALTSIGQGVGGAFGAMGKAIAQGKNGLQAFAGAMLATLGQAAVQMGTQFILQGAAYTWAGMPNGPPLMAAGAALATFGGLLSGLGGGSADAGSGGGVGYSGASQTNQPQQKAKPETNVQVVVQGNILDRRETGLHIVETLNEYFNTNDGSVKSSFA